MERIATSVLCTREEYIAFCAAGKSRPGLTAAGVLLLLFGAGTVAAGLTDLTTALLPILFGAAAVLYDPLLLPTFRKGEAARRYDESDCLSKAVGVVFEGESLTLDSARVSGKLPLSAVTGVKRAAGVLALEFGAELTVLIPMRALTDSQVAAIEQACKTPK